MFKKIFLTIDSIIEKVGNWGLLASGILILLTGFLDSYAVFRRYVLHNPEFYSYEIGVMFLTALCVLAVSGLQYYKRHLRVDFIASYLPPKTQIFLMDILTPILGLVYVGIIVWQSLDSTIYSFNIGETSQSAWQEPIWFVKAVIPLCMFWLCLVLISQLVKGIGKIFKYEKTRA